MEVEEELEMKVTADFISEWLLLMREKLVAAMETADPAEKDKQVSAVLESMDRLLEK